MGVRVRGDATDGVVNFAHNGIFLILYWSSPVFGLIRSGIILAE